MKLPTNPQTAKTIAKANRYAEYRAMVKDLRYERHALALNIRSGLCSDALRTQFEKRIAEIDEATEDFLEHEEIQNEISKTA